MTEERASLIEPSKQPPRWFHFRWRTLLVIPLALVVLGLFYGPRQYRQRQTLLALQHRNATVRTDPVAIPLVLELAGEDYAVEITEVYWRSPQTSDADLAILSGLSSLQKLELGGASITDDGLKHLARCSGLYTLHLADTRVTDLGLPHLAGLSSLGILSLDRTLVTDPGLAHLAALENLERLFLDDTAITDEGLKQIGQFGQLRELSINRTSVSDEGLSELFALKNLELLKANETAVTEAGRQALRKALPRCQVLVPGVNE